MTKATELGYDSEGRHIVLWEQPHPWRDELGIAFISVEGAPWLPLDHVDPGLIEALRASLAPISQEAVA